MHILSTISALLTSQKINASFATCAVVLLTGAQGCVSREFNSEGSESDVLLVGGAPASATQFPSVVQLPQQSCTAVKIGLRHLLTARHCVAGLKKGAVIQVQSGVNSASKNLKSATLDADVIAHSSVDLAVVKLTTDPLSLPVAQLSNQAPKVSEVVTLVGYGCTGRSSTPIDIGGPVFTSGTGTDELRYLVGPLSRVTSTDVFYKANLPQSSLSAGVALPGLCPGDSGGPLWNNQLPKRVVGINSSYHPAGESHFVRVDIQAANGVYTWIQNALK